MSVSSRRPLAGVCSLRVIDGGLSEAGGGEDLRHRHDLAAQLDVVAGIDAEELNLFGEVVDSAALAAALDAVAGAADDDQVLVPREPDGLMQAVGAAVAGVDRATAARIYRAMVRLAE